MSEDKPTVYDIPLVPASVTRHIYLTEGLENPSNYILTCQSLLELEEYDVANLHINSGGGDVSISNMITNAMSKCKAHVVATLESNAHSAASVIFLHADSWEVAPNASMHIHVGYFGVSGDKANEVIMNAEFTQKLMFNYMRDSYKGFLTDEEIEDLLKGQDFRFDSDEIIERLGNLAEYRAKTEVVEVVEETVEESILDSY